MQDKRRTVRNPDVEIKIREDLFLIVNDLGELGIHKEWDEKSTENVITPIYPPICSEGRWVVPESNIWWDLLRDTSDK